MSPYTGPRCPRCGGSRTFFGVHPERRTRVICADCDERRATKRTFRASDLAALAAGKSVRDLRRENGVLLSADVVRVHRPKAIK